jgi:hypothetical protein
LYAYTSPQFITLSSSVVSALNIYCLEKMQDSGTQKKQRQVKTALHTHPNERSIENYI